MDYGGRSRREESPASLMGNPFVESLVFRDPDKLEAYPKLLGKKKSDAIT